MKKLFVLLTMAFLPILASAQAGVNELRISDIKGEAGEQIILPVELVNDQSMIAFGAFLVLPEGVRVEDMALTDRWNSKTANIQYKMVQEGLYKFVGFNLRNVPISGNEGSIVDVTLNVDKNLAAGVYEIRLEQIELAPEKLPDGTDRQNGNLRPEDWVAVQTIGKASLEIKGRGDATGISNVPSAIRENAGIYDLMGRRLKTAPQKGVYIQGKKKIAKH